MQVHKMRAFGKNIKFDSRRGYHGIGGKINPVLESIYLWIGLLLIINT